MHYLHSEVIDPTTYETQGLCDGIPLRAHLRPELEDLGTLRAQEDWRKLVDPMGQYKGGLGPRFSFMTVSVPECIPGRLEIISYANEFAFLHDDMTDIIGKSESDLENDQMLQTFKMGAEDGTNPSCRGTSEGKRQIQAKMMLEMMSIDRECALTTMKVWAKFVELASGRQHYEDFESLDEYMEYRVLDVGQMFWYGMMTFGMGLRIPESEEELCKSLCRPAWEAAGLTNDLFSYEKEYEASKENGLTNVVNAIWVMMKEHGITEEAAKQLCRQKIKTVVAQFVEIVEQTGGRNDISEDLKKYVKCLQYSLSGNVVWSLTCPRYNKCAKYNVTQLDWMQNGIPTNRPSDQSDTASTGSLPGTPVGENNEVDVNEVGVTSNEDVAGSPHVVPTDVKQPETFWLTNDKVTNGAKTADNTPNNKLDPFLRRKPYRVRGNVVNGPWEYLSSLPSKGVREQAIDAFNVWCRASKSDISAVKEILRTLHNASLMLDDFEDCSPLRRGKSSTHTIFGEAQTVNAAGFQIIRALDQVQQLQKIDAVSIFVEEVQALYEGQSLDLHWTCNLVCPSVPEYVSMVDNKTGALFRLLTKLLTLCAKSGADVKLLPLSNLLGRYFQIRDDYMNLCSAEYTKQKGSYEDLDEGKYSLPLIHGLTSRPGDLALRNVLVQRRVAGGMSMEHKTLVLERLREAGSFAYTGNVLSVLHREIENEVSRLEKQTGQDNHQLRLLVGLLKV